MHLIPTILCGGAGSRLWPVSRELHPKPFIRLEDGMSLLQKAFLRGAMLPGVNDILTVTNRELFFKIEDEFREVNKTKLKTSFILEPFGRNTAAAIATAALHILDTYDDSALLLILAADHLIANQEAFQQAVSEAIPLALDSKLITFGIKPTHPNTGYGYIEVSGQTVISFVEKPNLEKAQAYLDAQNFLWNSGMFLFSVKTILAAMQEHCPEILTAVKTCIERSRKAVGTQFTQLELEQDSFNLVPENSIDYAIMEKASNVAVINSNFDWTDLGSWSELGDLGKADKQGNCIEGEVFLHEVNSCYIRANERLIGAVGIDNLIIIDTSDALLVADKSRAQDVKHIYSQLKTQGHDAHKVHRTVHRPWGSYTILEESQRFKIKRLKVRPGASLSLQLHHHRSEHWVVVSGMAKVRSGDESFLLNTNESTYIPAGKKHRLENPGVIDLVLIEVQSGEYLREDDIIRFEDNYGRDR